MIFQYYWGRKMNSIKIEYRYRLLECDNYELVPIYIIHFQENRLNSNSYFFGRDTEKIFLLEIQKVIIELFPDQSFFSELIIENDEWKIVLDLPCCNAIQYIIKKSINSMIKNGVLYEYSIEKMDLNYSHKNYCLKKNLCCVSTTICRIQQLRNELLWSQNESFYLVYQPKIDVKNEHVHSFEVLTRWRHPNYGEIAPGDFLKIIKDMRYQYEFDRFVIKKSCQEVRQFINSVHHFSVNISIFTLEQNEFHSYVENVLEETGINPQKLVIEILEDENILNYENMFLNLNRLIQKGIHISLDDFGIGFSSYYRLVQLNVSEIKIPREFFKNEFQSNLKNEKILTGIVNMCKDMKIQVVAEGIESIVDVEFAKSLGIDYIQGYYYSKPLEKNFFIDYLMNQNDLN